MFNRRIFSIYPDVRFFYYLDIFANKLHIFFVIIIVTREIELLVFKQKSGMENMPFAFADYCFSSCAKGQTSFQIRSACSIFLLKCFVGKRSRAGEKELIPICNNSFMTYGDFLCLLSFFQKNFDSMKYLQFHLYALCKSLAKHFQVEQDGYICKVVSNVLYCQIIAIILNVKDFLKNCFEKFFIFCTI